MGNKSLLLLPKLTYFSRPRLKVVTDRFNGLPHKLPGTLVAEDSTKYVKRIEVDGKGFAVKSWTGLTSETRQAAINELAGRTIAEKIRAVIGELDQQVKITIPPAIAYETDEEQLVVVVTDFFEGACHLNTNFVKELPVEAKATIVIIPTLAGAHQFPTSSVLCRKTRDKIEVALIDWESIHSDPSKSDFATQVLFCLLMTDCKNQGEEILEKFKGLLTQYGNNWLTAINSEQYLQCIARAIEAQIGTTPQGVSTPEAMAGHLLNVADYYRPRNFMLWDEQDQNQNSPDSNIETNEPLNLLDEQKALSYCNNDSKLLKDLVRVFLDAYQGWLAELSQAIKDNNVKNVQRSAHTIKGSLGIFCDEKKPPFTTALSIEQMGQNGDFIKAKETYPELESQISSLVSSLTAFLNKSSI